MNRKQLLTILCLVTVQIMNATPNVGQKERPSNLKTRATGCDNTAAVIYLDINNVKTLLMTGGDMWWDRSSSAASYEVPKGSKRHSLFAGSIWIGGYDKATNQLKVAAQTYRQSGNDYWAGPLDEDKNYSITQESCAEWDRFWKINASDISKFRNLTLGVNDPTQIQAIINNNQATIPDIIKEWPAKGNKEIKSSSGAIIPYAPKRDMAPYVDVDGQPGYNWRGGDYPDILGDQYIWWIFNDRGNIKTETQSEAIGLEIHAAAFAFSTNDCLNEATFYNYKVYNFSTSQLDSTYMASWNDADLGYAFDDFVGCDTSRGLGILYNGDAFDEGATGYGSDIPMVGVDFFQGPKYKINGKDTELKMTVFTYYNNDFSVNGNPSALNHFYQYMTASWKNGTPFTTACNAIAAGPSTKTIFYGDPCKGGWSEASCNNAPADRRFIHASGPFPLVPGAEPNNITIGAVWVPSVGGGSAACFSKLQVCDDKAQDLFDLGFKLPAGPEAPKVAVQALDKKLVFDLDNLISSNNFGEGYGTNMALPRRAISSRAQKFGNPDSLYKFEGYIVYQLKNQGIALSDIRAKDGSINTDVARVAFQCDIKNGIKDIINYEIDPSISSENYIPKLVMTGKDEGIKHSFVLTQDLFAPGTSKSLINYKTYYYIALAYGYNNFKNFDPNKPDSCQLIQYLESRTDGKEQPIQIIKAMPTPANDSLYVQTYADYGTGIQIKRLEGRGNSGIYSEEMPYFMDLTTESEMEALQSPKYQSITPTYKPNAGPFDLKVVNPNNIVAGDYEVWFKVDSFFANPADDTSRGVVPQYTSWFVKRVGTNEVVYSDRNIVEYNEKYLRKYDSAGVGGLDWGISLNAKYMRRPGDDPKTRDNGLIMSDVTFEDVNNKWLSGIPDEDGKSFWNWIRAGSEFQDLKDELYRQCPMNDYDNYYDQLSGQAIFNNLDQLDTYEKILDGTWAPYYFAANVNEDECGMGLQFGTNTTDRRINSIYSVSGVDIVFTSDKSKWSRCPVIEMTESKGVSQPLSENQAFKYNIRRHAGWNKEYDANGNPVYSNDQNDYGMSWFPGYAINVETGERLNIYFGEESFNSVDNGRDMIWNPTSSLMFDDYNKWGGKHVVYVAKTKYDEGKAFKELISKNSNVGTDQDLRTAYRTMMWVGVPILARGFKLASLKDGIIPTTTRLRIRVRKPFTQYIPDPSMNLRNGGWPLYTFSTKDIAPAKLGDGRNDYTNNKKDLLKRIQPVPNPYYAYSQYENSRVDNRIKIINLPEKAAIKIYTLDGALIKSIDKNDKGTTYVEWDMKNSKGIPIASGMYLIHVNVPDVGETVLKWFGAMRPVDLISF